MANKCLTMTLSSAILTLSRSVPILCRHFFNPYARAHYSKRLQRRYV